jgi:hypothetical protein
MPSSCSRISRSSTTAPPTLVSHTNRPSEALHAVMRSPTALTTVSCSCPDLRWPWPRGSVAKCCRHTRAPSLGLTAPMVWFCDIEYSSEALEPAYGFWKRQTCCKGECSMKTHCGGGDARLRSSMPSRLCAPSRAAIGSCEFTAAARNGPTYSPTHMITHPDSPQHQTSCNMQRTAQSRVLQVQDLVVPASPPRMIRPVFSQQSGRYTRPTYAVFDRRPVRPGEAAAPPPELE